MELNNQAKLQQEMERNLTLAPLIQNLNSKRPFNILEADKQYLLRCTDGIFKGKFLFINVTPDGEVFGSGDPEQNQDITMYIEQAGLSLRHASIVYTDADGQPFYCEENSQGFIDLDEFHGHYMLRDCGSETGTWVGIKESLGNLKSTNLHKCVESSIIFKVGDHQFTFQIENQSLDEVQAFLGLLPDLPPRAVEAILKFGFSFSKFREVCDLYLLTQAGFQTETAQLILRRLKQISVNKSQKPIEQLCLKFIQGPLKNQQVRLDGLRTIFGSASKNHKSIKQQYVKTNFQYVVLAGEGIMETHFEIVYSIENRCLNLKILNGDIQNSQGVYRKLEASQFHDLKPDDAFRIGSLEFHVQRFNTGVFSDIGQRPGMEDTFQVFQDLRIHSDVTASYFAVFDGHGGDSCSNYLKKNLHVEIVKALLHPADPGRPPISESVDFEATLVDAIKEAFKATDLGYQVLYPEVCKTCGSTAIVCLIIGMDLICINLGDARAVLCREGRAIDLSVDYKASRKDEQERIKSQGGYIVFGRVLGRLAVTRAFGDFECKQISIMNEETKQNRVTDFVLCEPEIRITQINRISDDFIILASDGLYDRFSSQECVEIARQEFLSLGGQTEQDPQIIAQKLVTEATQARVNSDNTTVIVVSLNTGILEGQGL